MKHIHSHYKRKLKVDELVSIAGLSRRAFEVRFKKITGLAVYQYIFNLRIEKFAFLLLASSKSIFQLAIETGFEDNKNIARQFKKLKGCTPLQYRKAHQISLV